MINRNNIYSIMKGLAIMGVVAGHLGINKIDLFVNYWHLPVFFFVSGYFLKDKYINDGKKYVSSRFKRLIIPFFFYASTAIILHNFLINWGIIDGIKFVGNDYWVEIKRMLLLSSNEQLIGAMWFLPALFFISCIGWSLLKLHTIHHSLNYKWGGVICFIVGMLAINRNISSPYCIFQYLSITWIFLLGYMVRTEHLEEKIRNIIGVLVSISILSVALFAKSRFGCQPSMIGNMPLCFPLVFISGIVIINYISFQIQNYKIGKVLSFVGNYSFSIMALHFVGFKIVTFIHKLIDDTVTISDFPISSKNLYMWAPMYFLVGLAFPIVVSILGEKIKNAWCNNCRVQKSGANG